jgi:drug/metabolite transporter (DMT)-like permease
MNDTKGNDIVIASLWMLMGIAAFLGLMIGVRQLSASMSVFQMLTLRSLVAFFVLIATMRFFQGSKIQTNRMWLHFTRNFLHFIGQYCWTMGIILLPMAKVIAIEFTTPIWAVLLAAVFLNEKLSLKRILVLLFGLAGVWVIVRPGMQTVELGTIYAFIATIGFAFTMLTSKQLTRTESVWTILFYMSVIQFFIGIIPAINSWVWPGGIDWFWIVIIGICGMLAHLGLTKALSLADTATVLPLDYLRLPATVLIGLVFYGETTDIWVLVGASMIFAANYFHIRSETK